MQTLTFITTFQLGDDAVAATRWTRWPRSSTGTCCPATRAEPAPGNPFAALDDRPGRAPVRGAPLRQGDRPRGAARGGGRQRRGRERRGLSARDPADPRGLPRLARRRRLPARGARRGRLDRRPRHVAGDAARARVAAERAVHGPPIRPRPAACGSSSSPRAASRSCCRARARAARGRRGRRASCGRGSSGAWRRPARRASASRAAAGTARSSARPARSARAGPHARPPPRRRPARPDGDARASDRALVPAHGARTRSCRCSTRRSTRSGVDYASADDRRPAHALGLVLDDGRDELQLAPAAGARRRSSSTSSGTRPATSSTWTTRRASGRCSSATCRTTASRAAGSGTTARRWCWASARCGLCGRSVGRWRAARFACVGRSALAAVTEGEGEPPALVVGRIVPRIRGHIRPRTWHAERKCSPRALSFGASLEPFPSMPEPRPAPRKRPS